MRVLSKAAILLFCAVYEASAQPDFSSVKEALTQFRAACEKEKGSLWGISLWGRLLLVDPASRAVLATDRVPDGRENGEGLYAGTLPAEILLANTSVKWGDHDWAMITLPLPADPFLRIRLLAHESFHRVQTELKLSSPDTVNSHLDSEMGRLWLRLELRALARALREQGDTAKRATTDALLFRAMREKLYPQAREQEASLEIQEGLAEYTGTVVALVYTGESLVRVARLTENGEDSTAFARGFVYSTGPALGLLLDRYAARWRKNFTRDRKLAVLLANAVGFRNPPDPTALAKERAAQYGYSAVAAAERERAVQHEKLLSEFRARFLDGPTLQFPKSESLNRSFNPSNLVSFGDHGTVYPTGIFRAPWGRLQIDSVGALLSPDNQSVRVAAPQDPAARPLTGPVTGPGWKLELAPGWTIRPGGRKGDFEVAREQ